jgi:hypothetical protein
MQNHHGGCADKGGGIIDTPCNRESLNMVTCRLISRQSPKYANVTIEKVLQDVFLCIRAMSIVRQQVAKHIPA